MTINSDNRIDLIAIFIFYRISNGKQARLSFHKHFKHINVITFDGRDYVMLDFDRTGLLTRTIHCSDVTQLLRSLRVLSDVIATVCVRIKYRKNTPWKPWWVRSCNEISRYATGIDLGFTFNPIHFYIKLLKYRHKRNYEMLSHWRRKHGILRR